MRTTLNNSNIFTLTCTSFHITRQQPLFHLTLPVPCLFLAYYFTNLVHNVHKDNNGYMVPS